MSQRTEPLFRFGWTALDEGNCNILTPEEEAAYEVSARSISHALQKIAAALPNEEPHSVIVWRIK